MNINISSNKNDCFLNGLIQLRDMEVLQTPTIILCVVNIVLAVVASTGNLCIILAILKNSNLRTPTNTLICALAFSDLGVGILVQTSFVPFKIAEIKKDDELFCLSQIFHFATAVFFSIFSLLIITSIAMERYLALRLGVNFNSFVTVSRVVKVVAGCLLLSFAVLLIGFAKYQTVMDVALSLIVFVCLIVNTFAYSRIYRKMRRRKCRLHPKTQQSGLQATEGNNENNAFSTTLAKYNRTVNTALGISALLLICYVPITCSLLSSVVANVMDTKEMSVINIFIGITSTLTYLNSALNPLLYMFRMRNLRSSVLSMIQTIFYKFTG